MERALSLDHLRLALGEGGALPSAEELQERLAEAEIALFLQRGEIDDELLATAWYLHAVGTARVGLDLYPVDRQLRANQTSAHIFDLALSSQGRDNVERREMTFASQIGYIRGKLDPNAIALYRRLPNSSPRLRDAPSEVSLGTGSSLLALDRARLFPRLQQLRLEADQLRRVINVIDLIDTPLGAAARVVEGCFDLLVYLTYGHRNRLSRALELFDEAIDPPYAQADLNSRWVAAHLRDIAEDLGTTSVWAHRPPSVPSAASQAMTLGDPPVLSLWPPQLDLLSKSPNPLDPSVRRLVLSFPTSAGKTLMAQYLVLAHVASGAGKACIVAPTHSLVRELQRDLDRRLGILGSYADDADSFSVNLPTGSLVTIMTPEKFATHLRIEPQRMLNDFSLFLIDEAHLVGDADRGWVIESALGFLHSITDESHHRIVLLSAALGNRSHIGAWVGDNEKPATIFHSDWSGPRRVHALFGTEPDWSNEKTIPPTRRGGLSRKDVPLYGTVHIRTGPTKHQSLRTTESIATLVLKRRGELEAWKKDTDKSDPQYKIRARMATILGIHGSVLIVESTKQAAQRTATALANEIDEDAPGTGALVALAETRLGAYHPLVYPLRRGVGFHHAALPSDIQAELEDAIRTGILRYLVATTTLIEGVNFPVRSVLIGDLGFHTQDGYLTTLTPSKMLNAVGRAGRAGRETEGWVVLAINEQFTQASFAPLTVDDTELIASSRLSTAAALNELANFEELLLHSEDAVMETPVSAVSDFISYIWFVATALDELQRFSKDPSQIGIQSTLAWQQLSPADQDRWRRVADIALLRYQNTPELQRRRWARTGTSLSTASKLDSMAAEVKGTIQLLENRNDPVEAFILISGQGRLEQMLNLSECKFRPFRPRRNASSHMALSVDVRALVVDWLRGRELEEIGKTHLQAVTDENYRYEQLSEFVSSILEHFLPWTLSTIVAWVNEDLEAEEQLCSDLPTFLRYGVDRPVALELSRMGVRSRRLVHRIATFANDLTVRQVEERLLESDVRTWQLMFDASPRELADLLFFTRAKDARITSRALAGEIVVLPLSEVFPAPPGPVNLNELDEDLPSRIAVVRDNQVIGYVGAAVQNDVSRLITTGVPLSVALTDNHAIEIRVVDPGELPSWFTAT